MVADCAIDSVDAAFAGAGCTNHTKNKTPQLKTIDKIAEVLIDTETAD